MTKQEIFNKSMDQNISLIIEQNQQTNDFWDLLGPYAIWLRSVELKFLTLQPG